MSAIVRALALFTLVWIPVAAVGGWMASGGLISPFVTGLLSSLWFLAALAVTVTVYRRGDLK